MKILPLPFHLTSFCGLCDCTKPQNGSADCVLGAENGNKNELSTFFFSFFLVFFAFLLYSAADSDGKQEAGEAGMTSNKWRQAWIEPQPLQKGLLIHGLHPTR